MSKIANLKETAEIRALADAELDHVHGGVAFLLAVAFAEGFFFGYTNFGKDIGLFDAIPVGDLIKGKGK